jgi:hypothetical protein
MKKMLLAFLLLAFFMESVAAAETPADLKREVNAFVDEWHDDAAHARLRYFDKMAKDGVYIGTDKSENWTTAEFRVWAKKYFDAKKAWTFRATRRNVFMSANQKSIWFDELLDTDFGPAIASGVINRTDRGFEIVHYQLSMAVPNDIQSTVVKLIKDFEAAQPLVRPATPTPK